jgi:hypothetical protein
MGRRSSQKDSSPSGGIRLEIRLWVENKYRNALKGVIGTNNCFKAWNFPRHTPLLQEHVTVLRFEIWRRTNGPIFFFLSIDVASFG